MERPEAAQRELAGDPMAKLLGQTSGSQTLWSEDKLWSEERDVTLSP